MSVIRPQLCTHLGNNTRVIFHRSTHRWGQRASLHTSLSTVVDSQCGEDRIPHMCMRWADVVDPAASLWLNHTGVRTLDPVGCSPLDGSTVWTGDCQVPDYPGRNRLDLNHLGLDRVSCWISWGPCHRGHADRTCSRPQPCP